MLYPNPCRPINAVYDLPIQRDITYIRILSHAEFTVSDHSLVLLPFSEMTSHLNEGATLVSATRTCVPCATTAYRGACMVLADLPLTSDPARNDIQLR